MKNILALALVLVLCFSLLCPVIAASEPTFVPSIDGGGDDEIDPGPDTPVVPGTDGGTDGSPDTGDHSNLMMWVYVLIAAFVALVATVVVYRRKMA